MNEILRVENITKKFDIYSKILRKKIGEISVLDDITFSIKTGEVLGLVGESGSGKTTIAKIITRLLPFDSGNIIIDSKEILSLTRQELAMKVQLIFQDPFASLNPRLSIKTIIGEVIKTRKKYKNERIINIEDEIKELLETVGLTGNILENYPHQFSGGQRQRIAIARCLAFRPSLIIADEPLSSLDVSVQANIINLFLDLKEKYSFSFLFISHDITLVTYFSDRVIVLKDGKIVEDKESMEIIKSPSHSYTKQLIDSAY